MEDVEKSVCDWKLSSCEYRRRLLNETVRILQDEKNFEFVNYLGGGAYGEVVAVNSPNHEETVALKILRSNDAWDGELILWPMFNHKNVLPLLEFIQLPQADLFITPLLYCDMETILEDEYHMNDPNGLSMAKQWLREILDAMDYLHSQNICHLDIKADNVLIDYDFKAVLCDFSFISFSDAPVERYGVPILYRPPETCLAYENCIAVDGIKFDMWCYGILAINVFTDHFLKKRVDFEVKKWHKEIYPLLYEAMQITRFRHLMRKAFPGSNTEAEFSDAFNFVQFILKAEPEDRPSIEDIMNHIFFKKGSNMVEKPDDIWIFQVKTACSCVHPEELAILHKDNFENYKYRKTFQKARVLYKRNRKWKKALTIIKIKKQVVVSAFEVSGKHGRPNNEQYNENTLTGKRQGIADNKLAFGTIDDVISYAVEEKAAAYQRQTHHIFGQAGDNGNQTQVPSKNKMKESKKNIIRANMTYRLSEETVNTIRRSVNQTRSELVLPSKSEALKNAAVEYTAIAMPGVLDDTEEVVEKKDLRSWLRQKISFCASNIRKMITSSNVRESPIEHAMRMV